MIVYTQTKSILTSTVDLLCTETIVPFSNTSSSHLDYLLNTTIIFHN